MSVFSYFHLSHWEINTAILRNAVALERRKEAETSDEESPFCGRVIKIVGSINETEEIHLTIWRKSFPCSLFSLPFPWSCCHFHFGVKNSLVDLSFDHFSVPTLTSRRSGLHTHTLTVSTCQPLIPPSDGRLLQGSGYFKAGDYVEFSCDPGFQMMGSSLSVCLENGSWSQSVPQCEYRSPFQSPHPSGPYSPFVRHSHEGMRLDAFVSHAKRYLCVCSIAKSVMRSVMTRNNFSSRSLQTSSSMWEEITKLSP